MNTGENEQGLRKILDMTRLMRITVLIMHCYYYCYGAFNQWQLTTSLTDQLLHNIKITGLFNNFHTSKLLALAFLAISLMGGRGKKDEKLNAKRALCYIIIGLLIYFLSYIFLLSGGEIVSVALLYMVVT